MDGVAEKVLLTVEGLEAAYPFPSKPIIILSSIPEGRYPPDGVNVAICDEAGSPLMAIVIS